MKSLYKTLTISLLMVFTGIASASIGPTIKEYEASKNDNSMRLYVNAVAHGIQWANAELATRKQTRIYCPSPQLTITEDNYIEILDDTVKSIRGRTGNNKVSNLSLGLVLLHGLKETFPCSK